jgi:hypothetical protein
VHEVLRNTPLKANVELSMTQAPPSSLESGPGPEMAEALGLNEQSGSFFRRRRWQLIGVLVIVAGTFAIFRPGTDAQDLSFRTAPIMRDGLTVTVTATGTIEPLRSMLAPKFPA